MEVLSFTIWAGRALRDMEVEVDAPPYVEAKPTTQAPTSLAAQSRGLPHQHQVSSSGLGAQQALPGQRS